MPTDITKKVEEGLKDVIAAEGCEIVDVEYVKKYDTMHLTVFIDTYPVSGGVDLELCERVHNSVNPVIDELDPTHGAPYTLNISSPGLDRRFKKQRDYERNYGKEVEIKLYAPLKGKKVYEGTLLRRDENSLTLKGAKGDEVTIEMNKIAYTRPLIKFG